MARMVIDDVLWRKLEALLPTRETGGRPPKDNRLFIEAVCWVIRTGVPWRDLPPEYGSWKTVYNRYNRWCKTGEFDRILSILKKRWRSRMAYD
jgi:transposase